MPAAEGGIDDCTFAARFPALTALPSLAVAVSGGPDSMALIGLIAAQARRPRHVLVLTVDHGLRAEAAQEALLVAQWCAGQGLAHRTLRWEGEKPGTGIQEAAREARYRLMRQAMAEVGIVDLALAHHRDDQAETILFRLLRGSGMDGLAGMEARTERDGMVLHRPLLGAAKAELVATCEKRGLPFVRDPSNEDPHYARPRLRRLMPLLAAEGLDAAGLVRLGQRMGRGRDALQAAADAVLAEVQHRDGGVTLPRGAVAGLPAEVRLRVVAAMIERAGGVRPRLERLEALDERLGAALIAGKELSATLAGAQIVLRQDLLVRKAPPRRTPGGR